MKRKIFMKSRLYIQLATLAIVLLVAACGAPEEKSEKQKKLESLKVEQASLTKQIKELEAELAKENPAPAAGKSKDVAVTELTPHKFDHYVQTQGKVEADDNIQVSSKTMGVVSMVYVHEGQLVSKGQLMAQIDNALVEHNIASMRSQLELASSVYERQKNLWDQKIGTEVQYLQAKTSKEGLEKQLASLQEQNEMTRIKAPIDGTIDEVFAKTGENLSPGMPAFRVVNTSNLKLSASVSEAYVTNVKTGNKVLINIPELNQEIEARVTFVGRTIDALSRTFVVEIKLPSKADLRPNMTGIIKVVYNTEPSAITVPINIVQNINGEKVVYTAETDGKQTIARKKIVTVGGVFDGAAQVSGLKAGEKVITFGYQGLSDGEAVKI